MTAPDERIDLPGADLRLIRAPSLTPSADDLLVRLTRETPWRQDAVRLFGKTHPQPRLHAWVGDPGCAYRYSGLRLEPEPWTPLLRSLRDQIERLTGAPFNSVLLNLYRDGQDCMGLHADDEPELGNRPVIASLSLGAARRFDLRPRPALPDGEPTAITLPHGSLLVMAGDTQANWKHGIVRTRQVTQPRVNLTFRNIGMKSAAS